MTLKVGLIMAGVLVGVISGAKLSVVLLSGVVAMLLLNVVKIDEAYKAVDWRTVFLIAGLIPLGVAMEKTGAAINWLRLLLKNRFKSYLTICFNCLDDSRSA